DPRSRRRRPRCDPGASVRRTNVDFNDWGPTWRECAQSTGGHCPAVRRPARHDETGLGREVVPGRCRRVVPALDRALVHRQPGRGRVRGAVGAVDPGGRRLLDGRSEDAMSGLDVLLAVAGLTVTVLVVA